MDPFKPVVTMREWGVVSGSSDPYVPPEVAGIRLRGKVFGHTRKADGEVVVTSIIQSASGRMVETRNTVYCLDGPPHPIYTAYLEEHGLVLDEAQPVKIHTDARGNCNCHWVAGLGTVNVACPVHG